MAAVSNATAPFADPSAAGVALSLPASTGTASTSTISTAAASDWATSNGAAESAAPVSANATSTSPLASALSPLASASGAASAAALSVGSSATATTSSTSSASAGAVLVPAASAEAASAAIVVEAGNGSGAPQLGQTPALAFSSTADVRPQSRQRTSVMGLLTSFCVFSLAARAGRWGMNRDEEPRRIANRPAANLPCALYSVKRGMTQVRHENQVNTVCRRK